MIDEYIFIAILSFSFPLILYFFFLLFFFFYFFLLWFYDFLLYYTYVLFFLFCVNLLCVLNLWLPCFTSMSISPITICLRKKGRKEGRKKERERERKRSRSVISNSLRAMDCSLTGSSIHGIFQARILEWTAISFSRGSSQSRDLPNPGIEPRSPELQADSTFWATRESGILPQTGSHIGSNAF